MIIIRYASVRKNTHRHLLAISLSLICTLFVFSSNGYAGKTYVSIDIPSQEILGALETFAKQTDLSLIYYFDNVDLGKSKSVSGKFVPVKALDFMLEDTGLVYEQTGDRTFSIKKDHHQAQEDSQTKADASEASDKKAEPISDASEGEITDKVTQSAKMSEPKVKKSEGESTEDYMLEETVVTAQKREQEIQDVPMAITVVKTEDYIMSGTTSFHDLLRYTPGFSSSPVSENGSSKRNDGNISARGVGQQGSANVVGIYVDDVCVSSQGSFAFNDRYIFDGLLLDIERVEMLKGPQGTLFGASSVGGAVRFITRKPSLDEIRGSVQLDFNYVDDGEISQLYMGRISTPILKDKIGLTVSGFIEDRGGWVDTVDGTTEQIVLKDINGSDALGYVGDLYFQFSDRCSFDAKLMYQESDSIAGSATEVVTGVNTPLYSDYSITHVDSIEDTEVSYTVASGVFEYDFDWALFTSVSSYAKNETYYNADAAYALGSLFETLLQLPSDSITSIPNPLVTQYEKYTQELRLTSPSSDKFEWLGGLFYTNEESENVQGAFILPYDITLLDVQLPSEYTEYAVFGNFTYYLIPEFDITLGGRYSSVENSLTQLGEGLVVPADFGGNYSVEDEVTTWSVALRYRPLETLSLYGSVKTGYRSAQPNIPREDLATGEVITGTFLDSDDAINYELGAKGVFWEGRFSYDVALWMIEWNNFQTKTIINGANASLNAADGITAKGFDCILVLRPVNGLSVTGALAYSESTLNSDEPLLYNGPRKGQQTPGVPEWAAMIKPEYTFYVADNVIGHVGAGLRYTEGSYSNWAQSDLYKADDRLLVDMNVGFSLWERYHVNAYVTNLFNDNSIIYRYSEADLIVQERPRTIGVSLVFDF